MRTPDASMHYYVLSFNMKVSKLYEGFRDKLIDIEDGQFPLEISKISNSLSDDTRLRKFIGRVDRHFSHYYEQEPLRLILVGEKSNLTRFETLSARSDIVIGKVDGDYIATTPRDLGKIVWPIVKEVLAGTNKNAMHELEMAIRENKVISGINAVGLSAGTSHVSTLYVEEDYHVKGSIREADQSLIISKHVDMWEVIDDVVDVVIEKVLKTGGTVIFLTSGSLTNLKRIALIND